MNICVVGTGYVGLVTGTCFSEFGLKVTCVDNDEAKIASLQNGRVPFFEPGLEEMVRKNMREGQLSFTTDLSRAVDKALVILIAVGTPPRDDGSADLSYVEEVARAIGTHINGYKVVVTKSTVPVGTGERIREIILSTRNGAFDFDVVSNPEFLREGSAIEDFMRPDRVVIGASSPQAIAIMKDLYSPLYLIETPFIVTNVESAEMIKYASNAFLAAKVSFINEIANICERVGADVNVVAKGMGHDRRIGPKFLHAGPGYGGSCFPKDTRAITQIARLHGYEFGVVDAVIRVNESQKKRMVEKVRAALGDLRGRTIGVLGLSFKPNTDDLRESPATWIVQELIGEGARCRLFDPAALEGARSLFPSAEFCEDAYDAARGADALLILTEWNQFRNLDFDRLGGLLKAKRLIDLRNVYDPRKMAEIGFEYVGVGRGLESAGKAGAVGAGLTSERRKS
ncbi:MAG: UDP-glucose/GDP-mannose dehydrogenase family protein [Nitrospirae bacterium]|nr:UDP-glucose/GDP-mannose dehydrogenase family protein [Nitrospirota bacterium]